MSSTLQAKFLSETDPRHRANGNGTPSLAGRPASHKEKPTGVTGPWLGRSIIHPAVIGMFHRYGILSGAALSRILGVGRSSAHLILDRLHKDGCLVIEQKRPDQPLPPGRPTTDYQLDPERGLFLGMALENKEFRWHLAAFNGAPVAEGTIDSKTCRSTAGLVHAVNSILKSGHITEARPLLQATLAIDGIIDRNSPGIVVESHLLEDNRITLAPVLSAVLRGVPVEVLNLASVGAISESLREFRNPAPTLFVWVEDNYRVRAGFALAGRVLAGSNGRAGTIFAESGDLVSIGDNPALLKYQSWTSLLAAAIELDGQAKAAHELLVARLAERLQDLAAFLDPSQVVIGSADPTLGADIAARISRGWALRVSGAPMPSVERALFGGSTLARGAALLPIASVISRALEIEELEPSRKAGPTGSAGVLRMFAA